MMNAFTKIMSFVFGSSWVALKCCEIRTDNSAFSWIYIILEINFKQYENFFYLQ